jgi:hypothetical protein
MTILSALPGRRSTRWHSRILMLCAAAVTASCTPEAVANLFPDASIAVNPTGDLALSAGQNQTLNLTLKDGNPAVDRTTFTVVSSTPAVATAEVTTPGVVVVHALSAGSTVLTIRQPGTGATKTVNVAVTALNVTITMAAPTDALRVGGTTTVTANVVGSTDLVVAFQSRTPGTVSIVSQTGNTAVVKGVLGGSAIIDAVPHADPTKKASATVNVTSPQLGLLGLHYAGGAAAHADSIAGVITANYSVANGPVGDEPFRLRTFASDSSTTPLCDVAFALGALFTPDCQINTAAVDSTATGFTARILNGPHNLTAKLVGSDGRQVASIQTPLTLNNQSGFFINVNNPAPVAGQQGPVWRAGNITVTVIPVNFSPLPVFGPATVSLVPTRLSGTGTVQLNQTGAIPAPFTFNVNNSASGNAEGEFQFTPHLFNGSGQEITNTFTGVPFPLHIDLRPPQVTQSPLPSTLPFFGSVVTLGHATGSAPAAIYPPDTDIPLVYISGGFQVNAHPPQCDALHLHGAIRILNLLTGVFEGPYGDPDSAPLFDPCGHGKISSDFFQSVAFNADGSVADGSPLSIDLQLFRCVNGCDTGPALVDDVPIAQGTAPGQSPFPAFRSTVPGAFRARFVYEPDPAVGDLSVVLRHAFSDAAVDEHGAKTNVISGGRVIQLHGQ